VRDESKFRSPFGPIKLPDQAMKPWGTVFYPDGSKRRVWMIYAASGVPLGFAYQVFCNLIPHELTEIKPMEQPVGTVFFENYTRNHDL